MAVLVSADGYYPQSRKVSRVQPRQLGVSTMKEGNTGLTNKSRFNHSVALTSLAMAAMTVGSSQAFAALVCSSGSIPIPNSGDGIYLNFVTGATGSAGSATAGWDFNAYADVSALNFFSSSAASNNTRYVGTGTTVSVLGVGTLIDATSSFSSAGIAPGGAFRAGVVARYVGVTFKNEGTAAMNFGWVSLTTTGPTGFPATINQYCYRNDGTGIMTPSDKIFGNGFDA